jgi:hypothetical protein
MLWIECAVNMPDLLSSWVTGDDIMMMYYGFGICIQTLFMHDVAP